MLAYLQRPFGGRRNVKKTKWWWEQEGLPGEPETSARLSQDLLEYTFFLIRYGRNLVLNVIPARAIFHQHF